MSPGTVSPPLLLRPEDVRYHFGLERKTVYNMINSGELRRGKHYIKRGKAVLLIYAEFAEFLLKGDEYYGRVY
jgi:hypothetical protein